MNTISDGLWKGKVALVTGAGPEIGEVIAVSLAKVRCTIEVNDINERTGEKTFCKIRALKKVDSICHIHTNRWKINC